MKPTAPTLVCSYLICILLCSCPCDGAGQIDVVNMIPKVCSGETHQDSEPNLAVSPKDPQFIAGSAFTPDPMKGPFAPIFVSIDGGNTWALNSIVPSSSSSGSATGDITIRFSGSNQLYAGILRLPGSLRLNILRTPNIRGDEPMSVLVDREYVDQPYVRAATVPQGGDTGRERVYVGNNDFAVVTRPRTASIDQSLDAGNADPPFTTQRLDKRSPLGQDLPPIRIAVHPDGTVYGVFYCFTAEQQGILTCHVVVVRAKGWATGAKPFEDLTDPDDNIPGRIVAKDRKVPWGDPGDTAGPGGLGQERIGGELSIAVDPRDSKTVYVVWADRVGDNDYTLHVRCSKDGGMTWSTKDLRTATNAKNGCLAVNSEGKVAFLYQQLIGTSLHKRWETHLERTSDMFATIDDALLAKFEDESLIATFLPYLGDYADLMSIGKNFYGVFSSSNYPDKANFPSGVTYQRNVDFASHKLLGPDNDTTVNASIDPFFFRVIEE